jgi:polar amino acid transport system substrate-binding protein
MVDTTAWKRCTVIAYLDEPPFSVPMAVGPPVGCDVEVAGEVLRLLGVERVEFVLTTFDQLIPGVVAGRWHMNAPIFITDERATVVRFSLPVWAAGDGFIVRSDDARDFSSYRAIARDHTIRLAVVTGQVQQDTALAAGVPPARIVEYPDQAAAARAVLGGAVDASASTAPGSRAFVERANDRRLAVVADASPSDRRGVPLGAFSFAPSAEELAAAFDAGLRRYLGTANHLRLMSRHGFTPESLRPSLSAAAVV